MAEYFKKFVSKLIECQEESRYPTTSEFPVEILFDSELKNQCRKLEDYTKEKNWFFKRREGSTGFEYSVTGVHFLNELIYSPPVTGEWEHVMPAVNFGNIKQLTRAKEIAFTFELGNKKTVHKMQTSYFNLQALSSIPKSSFRFRIFAVLHTHPKSRLADGSEAYTFFSVPDINFLINMPAMALGKISRGGLWLVFRSSDFSALQSSSLYKVTATEIDLARRVKMGESIDINQGMIESVKENLKGSGLVFYHGSFGSLLRKI